MDYPSSVKKSARKVRRNVTREPVPERPHTPENQSVTSQGGKTSTPTLDGSHLSHDMDIDASAIHPEVSLLAGMAVLYTFILYFITLVQCPKLFFCLQYASIQFLLRVVLDFPWISGICHFFHFSSGKKKRKMWAKMVLTSC